MDESTSKPHSIDDKTAYETLSALVMHSEKIRWSRLNAFLVLTSMLLVAWMAVFVRIPSGPRQVVLVVLCIPGILLGFIWARLGWRSSQYLDRFHDRAWEMEKNFPNGIPRPFHASEGQRNPVRADTIERYTASKFLVTVVPIVVAILFVVLLAISFLFEPSGLTIPDIHP
jgi:hypothetical protein